jgi:hypothetical protein
MDPKKVRKFSEWPTAVNIGEVRSFHGLASFYQKFIKRFRSVCNPMIETMKGDRKDFKWRSREQKSFELLKKKVIEKLVLALKNVDKIISS